MKEFIISEIDNHFVALYSICNITTMYVDRTCLPKDIEIGDKLIHIEHRYYDLYSNSTDGELKKGLIRLDGLRKFI